MPFREKMKRAFRRSSSVADGADLTKATSKASKKKDQDNIYKPGETPASKYRGPNNQAHQDKLSAFSFGSAWSRRKSDQSEYSPMGSKLPSRRGSWLSGRGPGARSRQQSHVGQVVESADADDDVANGTIRRLVSIREERVDPPLTGRSGTLETGYRKRDCATSRRSERVRAHQRCCRRPCQRGYRPRAILRRRAQLSTDQDGAEKQKMNVVLVEM